MSKDKKLFRIEVTGCLPGEKRRVIVVLETDLCTLEEALKAGSVLEKFVIENRKAENTCIAINGQ